jgi:uncharacterized protein
MMTRRAPQEKIRDFCRRHHIARLSLFGSVLTDNFTSEGDIDLLQSSSLACA